MTAGAVALAHGPGLHRGVSRKDYLALDAFGSGRLEWLAVSPKHYRYMLEQPAEESPSLSLGTALHAAVLEPDVFGMEYALEPLDVAPMNAKPRATNAYKEAVAEMEGRGLTVLREDTLAQVEAMAAAVMEHPKAAKLLAKAPERELTMIWNRDGRICRGRADLLGEVVLGDLKTTRSLRKFSPWAITEYGYHRQAAHYVGGLAQLGRTIERVMWIVVESSPPYDVGVFELDLPSLTLGHVQCDRLFEKLADCEREDRWPGMFEDVQIASVSDAALATMDDEAVA